VAYPPQEIFLMSSTNGVAEMIVIDVVYPASFVWRLEILVKVVKHPNTKQSK